MRGASGLLLLAVLLAGVGVGDGKILGARMSWELNPLFEGDDVTSVRKVTLKLTSAWETVGVCTAVVGQAVSGAGCVVESNFGQLCWYACRDVTNMACDPIQCVDNALVRDQPPGLDSEIFSQPYFQGTLTQEVTVPENKDMVVAFLKWADPSGGTFEMTSGGRSDYWVGFDPANSALFAPDMNPIVPTFIPLCTGAPETDGSVATCRLGQLENYYSPVPVYPLIVASPPDLSMQAPSYLKVSDLDGHQLKVEKAQSYVSGAWSSDPRENQGDLFHDVDPAGPSNGPQVLYSSIVGSRYTAKWIEVVDRTYDRLEPTDLQSSYKIFSRYSDTQASVQLALSVLDPSAEGARPPTPPPSSPRRLAARPPWARPTSRRWSASGWPGSRALPTAPSRCTRTRPARLQDPTTWSGSGPRSASPLWTLPAGTRSVRGIAGRAAADRRGARRVSTCRSWGRERRRTPLCWATRGLRTTLASSLSRALWQRRNGTTSPC